MSLNKLTYLIGILISLLSLICFFIYRSFEIIDFVNLFLLTNFLIGLTIIFLKKIRIIIFVNYFFSIIVIYSINLFLYFNEIRKIENGTILTQVFETEKDRINNKDIWPSITPSYLLNETNVDIYPLGTFVNRNIIICEEVKRIDIRVWKLRDEIEAAIAKEIQANPNPDQKVNIEHIQEFYTKFLNSDLQANSDDEDSDNEEENQNLDSSGNPLDDDAMAMMAALGPYLWAVLRRWASLPRLRPLVLGW